MWCPMMTYLLRRTLNKDVAPESHDNRTRLGMLAGWTSTVLSAVLAVAKGWFYAVVPQAQQTLTK